MIDKILLTSALIAILGLATTSTTEKINKVIGNIFTTTTIISMIIWFIFVIIKIWI